MPLTHREYSQSILFLTGHECLEKNMINWDLVSKLNSTLVIYMGYKNLEMIVSKLINSGKSPNTPIGLIQRGGMLDQKIILGKIGTINKTLKENKLLTPVIIIIGEVIDSNNNYNQLIDNEHLKAEQFIKKYRSTFIQMPV